jgi:hypothetical protein
VRRQPYLKNASRSAKREKGLRHDYHIFELSLALPSRPIIDNIHIVDSRLVKFVFRDFFHIPFANARMFGLTIMQAHNCFALLKAICLIRFFKSEDEAANLHFKF